MKMIPAYNTMLLCDVWDSYEEFKTEFDESVFKDCLLEQDLNLAYVLIQARFTNDPIANTSLDQWKLKFFSKIFQFGPPWAKRLKIQKSIRDIDDADLFIGSTVIYNHAYNPSAEPAADSLEPLNFINDQNVTNYKRSKLDAYALLWDSLKLDVTETFLNQFKPLFKKFVLNENPVLFITEEDDE